MAIAAVYQDRAAKTEATIATRAMDVFAQHRAWRFCHRKRDNHPFFMMEGSPIREDGVPRVPTYWVDLHDCTCPSHRDGRVACKHMRAVRLWFDAVKRGEIVVPRRMTPRDHATLSSDAEQIQALDTAEAADGLLDAYHRAQVQQRAARAAEPTIDWWLTEGGSIVWLQAGDRVGPDTEELVEVQSPVPPSVPPCRQTGCTAPCAPRESWCERHVLVDAL